jgi:hypothetical protein
MRLTLPEAGEAVTDSGQLMRPTNRSPLRSTNDSSNSIGKIILAACSQEESNGSWSRRPTTAGGSKVHPELMWQILAGIGARCTDSEALYALLYCLLAGTQINTVQ